jgi:hypothetical protein
MFQLQMQLDVERIRSSSFTKTGPLSFNFLSRLLGYSSFTGKAYDIHVSGGLFTPGRSILNYPPQVVRSARPCLTGVPRWPGRTLR